MQTNYYSTAGTPQRTLPGYDMNHLYLSPSHQQNSRPGIFLKRNEKIDWRRLAAVDVERIAREMDFQALQDNLEQITLCNIDTEIDSRAMDPNFVKLYKLAQLTIEYLLLCQDQITTQLGDYDQLKTRGLHEQAGAHREIEKLRMELADSKKESKKRRKMLETQQRMLMAQNSNYHTCPVCTHAFLSVKYLEAHMSRRHPDYDSSRRRERDVDVEKQIQHLRDELNRKESELQLVKVQKGVDEEKIRDRDAHIRQKEDEIRKLTTRMTILDDRFSLTNSNARTRPSSAHREESGIAELLAENKGLRAEIEHLKQLLQQAELDLKKEQKLKRRLEQDNENLTQEVANLKESLQLIQGTSGNSARLSEQLITYQNKYNEERALRKKLQEESPAGDQPTDRKSPAPSVHSVDSPVQLRPPRTTGILLTNYCPQLAARLKENPKFLAKYHDKAKKMFADELEDTENLGIAETDTRLTDLDFRTKMESVLQVRRNIRDDLPRFEIIRADLTRILDGFVSERMDVRRSITSIRSAGSKLVTFEDQQQPQKHSASKSPTGRHPLPPTTGAAKKDSGDWSSDATQSDNEGDRFARGGVQPTPRTSAPPTKGISALVNRGIRPSATGANGTIASLVRQPSGRSSSEGENESPVPPRSSGTTDKKRIIDQKLQESAGKGQKPGISALAQALTPSRKPVHAPHDDDDEETDTLTTLHTNPLVRPLNAHLPHLAVRELASNNPLSSGDVSQHTYDSLWKSQASKAAEHRRPATADSTKTSLMDSDENLDGDASN